MAQYARNPIVKNYLYRLQERTKPIDVTKVVWIESVRKIYICRQRLLMKILGLTISCL